MANCSFFSFFFILVGKILKFLEEKKKSKIKKKGLQPALISPPGRSTGNNLFFQVGLMCDVWVGVVVCDV